MGCTTKQGNIVEPNDEMNQIIPEIRNIGVEILPGKAAIKVEKGTNAKYLEYVKFMSNFWRLNQLAIPKSKNKKFVAVDDKGDGKKFLSKLPDHVQFYSENLAWPTVRILTVNKAIFQKLKGPKWTKRMNRNIIKSWGTIYNFYKNRKRLQMRMHRKRQKEAKKKQKKRSADEMNNIYGRLAKPKELAKPKKSAEPKKKKDVNFDHVAKIARPKQVQWTPPEFQKLNPFALKYVATPHIKKLSQEPARFAKYKPPYTLPIPISEGAKHYVATERIKSLTVPMVRHYNKLVIKYEPEDNNTDAFKVNPKALTYKITARIKKLAEPKERK